VVCSCGFSLPLVPILPSCFRVRTTVKEMVDGVVWGEVRSKTG
jgi:hypothetical protein